MGLLSKIITTAENTIAAATLDVRLAALEQRTGIPGLREAFFEAANNNDAAFEGAIIAEAQGIDEKGELQVATLYASAWRPAPSGFSGTLNSLVSPFAFAALNSYGLQLTLQVETPTTSCRAMEVTFQSQGWDAFHPSGYGQISINGDAVKPHTSDPQIQAVSNYVQRLARN